MKKFFQNRVAKNYFLLFITLFTAELIFRLVMNMPVADWAVLRIFLACNVLAMLCSLLFSFLGRIGSNIMTCVVALFASVYAVVQAGFYNYLGVFISLGTSSQLGAVKDYIKDYFDSFKNTFYLIFIPFVLLVLYSFIKSTILFLLEVPITISASHSFNR